jgi:hypothetical protein
MENFQQRLKRLKFPVTHYSNNYVSSWTFGSLGIAICDSGKYFCISHKYETFSVVLNQKSISNDMDLRKILTFINLLNSKQIEIDKLQESK